MRSNICVLCQKKIKHFGRGINHNFIKFRGGWAHYDTCYQRWMIERSRRLPTITNRNVEVYRIARIQAHHRKLREELNII